jgi:hypothetical protein
MTASALQTPEAFEVITDADNGAHYVVEIATGERVAGPYPLKKTANRRARQLCGQEAPAQADEALEPREPEGLDAAVLEEALEEVPAAKPPLYELHQAELARQAAEEPEQAAEEAPAEEEEGDDEAAPHAPAVSRPFQLVEPATIATREDWLIAATVRIRPILESMAGLELPAVRVTCGWPSKGGTGGKKRTIGECWNPEASSDGHAEVFINPMEADPQTVLAILTHELIHACLPKGTGHKAPFVKAAKAVGFATPVTQLTMPDELLAWVCPLVAALPDYPHAAINPRGAEGEKKKQTTRMIKAECLLEHDGEPCGYTVRLTAKWIKAAGAPICPRHREPMFCDMPDDAPEGEGDE